MYNSYGARKPQGLKNLHKIDAYSTFCSTEAGKQSSHEITQIPVNILLHILEYIEI